MDEKKHKFVTIADIIKVITPENIDNFLIDFRGWLIFYMGIKKMQDLYGKDDILIENQNEGVMIWVDDGKNNIDITIQVKKEK